MASRSQDADISHAPEQDDSALVPGAEGVDVKMSQQVARQQQGKSIQGKGSSVKAGHSAASRNSKNLVRSPEGVKKQTSPISKGQSLTGGVGLRARIPLRVRKNLEQAQVKHSSGDHICRNRGLADA